MMWYEDSRQKLHRALQEDLKLQQLLQQMTNFFHTHTTPYVVIGEYKIKWRWSSPEDKQRYAQMQSEYELRVQKIKNFYNHTSFTPVTKESYDAEPLTNFLVDEAGLINNTTYGSR